MQSCLYPQDVINALIEPLTIRGITLEQESLTILIKSESLRHYLNAGYQAQKCEDMFPIGSVGLRIYEQQAQQTAHLFASQTPKTDFEQGFLNLWSLVLDKEPQDFTPEQQYDILGSDISTQLKEIHYILQNRFQEYRSEIKYYKNQNPALSLEHNTLAYNSLLLGIGFFFGAVSYYFKNYLRIKPNKNHHE